MKNWKSKIASIVTVAALCGCAATKMETMQRSADFNAREINKVMVIGLFKTHELRKLYEEEFARQWRARGGLADSGLQTLPLGVALEKVDLAAAARKQGYDAVAITVPVSRQHVEPDMVGESNSEANAKLSDYVRVVLASPEYNTDFQIATLRTSIYTMNSAKRVWTGTTQTIDTGNLAQYVNSLVKVILDNIYKS